MNKFPKVLIISNKFDFSTDLVTHQLNVLKVEYLRINRDQFDDYIIELNPLEPRMSIVIDDIEFIIDEDHLKSIFFRAPTFLRDIFQKEATAEEQLFRTQWAAFIRALTVFENAVWVNNPVDTYKAEIKALQLKYAKEVGLLTPSTIITNATKKTSGAVLAIKSIDTAIVSTGDREAFVYTSIVEGDNLQDAKYTSPFFIQKALTPKVDVRLTIVGAEILAVYIHGGDGIPGDWRNFGKELSYEVFELPLDIKMKCLNFTAKFNLKYAAIDLVLYDSNYYFIEVNPTGEWAWLQNNTGIDIGLAIANFLRDEVLDR